MSETKKERITISLKHDIARILDKHREMEHRSRTNMIEVMIIDYDEIYEKHRLRIPKNL